jgi:hypothetical protein
MRMRWGWTAAVVAVAVLGGGGMAAHAQPVRTDAAAVDPGDFVRYVTNPFLPFKPGTVMTYRGVKDEGRQIEHVTVLHRTKRILGVRCTVVHDVIRDPATGKLLEETEDWYARDKHGNVWYFGEATKSYEPNGHVSTEGSWEAGVNGAVPGIVMEADPHAPDAYRQEFYRNHAEDMAWVLRRGGSVDVPFGHVRHILVTMEWSRLEPQVIDRKFYAKGFGIVREASATGPKETIELVAVHRP